MDRLEEPVVSEDLFRTYFESAPDFVLQVDPKGTILFINRTYTKIRMTKT